ncbi:alpha/beta fold hydrolase [Nonomuraea jiangxiensis]|uniref:Alpha/beta hydrolase family protein n=1 Tax=Nonomuraea jiangxiensis TaxID=633440 RepID=A0A1G8M428_9ACTN|nr:alpha/beta hydrolase [Nonomuraea jiangxiensis]SDI62567.1 Alpha/beta hydrolase family protein [Nonomuraea jiangxiensis]
MTPIRNIVLVHGGFVDGAGWQDVRDELTRDGLRVHIVPIPTLSLADDAAMTRRVLDGLDGPALLIGHSYGGVVISEAGTHPNVASLVYIAAFAPDRGESINTLITDPPAFMADVRVPWGVDALAGAVTEPAWQHRPSWYLVATQDRMIPPPAQRAMAERAGSIVVEVIAGHAVYVSQPAAVADLIRQAAAA